MADASRKRKAGDGTDQSGGRKSPRAAAELEPEPEGGGGEGEQGKRVWLVRHAESENNVSKRTFRSTFGSGRLPATRAEWVSVGQLPLVRMDTPLSAHGRRQAEAQRAVLDAADFVARERPELVLHSPLVRARDTCLTLFGGLEGGGPAVEQFDELYERSISEHLWRSWLQPRVARFTAHLLSRPERRIVAVGHSSFFEEMCGAVMGNASVWCATLSAEGQWRDVTLLHDTPADIHEA